MLDARSDLTQLGKAAGWLIALGLAVLVSTEILTQLRRQLGGH